MAHVRFLEDFDYRPTTQSVIGYLAGMEVTVKRDCATQAVAAGKAVEIKAARREASNGERTISK